MTVIVDTDALIGILNKDDSHHAKSIATLEELIRKKAKLIYPATTIAEATAVLQIRLNRQDLSSKIIELLIRGELIIEAIDESVLKEATVLLKPGDSKHNTLFDAVVATIAKKHSAEAVFSYDKFYVKQGLKLASEL